MSDRAISKDALLASLRDIRLPEAAWGDLVSNVTATLALASLSALCLVGLFRLLSRPRTRHAPAPVKHADTDRRVALLHQLKNHAPGRYAALRSRLYRRDGGLDLETLEAELDRHV